MCMIMISVLWLAIAGSQFTKRLESYGGVTTDHNCRRAATSLGCQTVDDGDDQTQCRANVDSYRNTLEPRQDRILQETFKDVPEIKHSTSSGSSQGCYYMMTRGQQLLRWSTVAKTRSEFKTVNE